MKAKIIALVAVLAIVGTAIAQKDKKWTDWNDKDAKKMLEDSPWAKTQNETDTSEAMFTPTSANGVNGALSTSNDASRAKQGASNQSSNVIYYVRFFSARPIRAALARQFELTNKGLDEKAVTGLHNFAEGKSPNSIIVTVSYKGGQGSDQRSIGPVMQAFNSAATGTLKNKTYLQRSDGKQLFLEEYVPPGKDGFGARFIFIRMPDEKPFVDAGAKEIRFYSEVSNTVKIDRRFKVAEMMYQGELEY